MKKAKTKEKDTTIFDGLDDDDDGLFGDVAISPRKKKAKPAAAEKKPASVKLEASDEEEELFAPKEAEPAKKKPRRGHSQHRQA